MVLNICFCILVMGIGAVAILFESKWFSECTRRKNVECERDDWVKRCDEKEKRISELEIEAIDLRNSNSVLKKEREECKRKLYEFEKRELDMLFKPAPQTIERFENLQKELEDSLQRVQRCEEECEAKLSQARLEFERKNADLKIEIEELKNKNELLQSIHSTDSLLIQSLQDADKVNYEVLESKDDLIDQQSRMIQEMQDEKIQFFKKLFKSGCAGVLIDAGVLGDETRSEKEKRE